MATAVFQQFRRTSRREAVGRRDSLRNTLDIANPIEGQLGSGRRIKRLHPGQVTLLREQAVHLVDGLPQRLTLLVEQTHDAVEAVSPRD